jgi:lycopene beta-cyclase
MPEYLLIITLLFFVSLAISCFIPPLFSSRLRALIYFASIFCVGFLFDWFSLWRGHWVYDEKFMVGWSLGGVPVEDYLFFLVIPYLCVVLYRWVSHVR